MPDIWPLDAQRKIADARELRVATERADGTLRPWVPIWVVCVDAHVYVRTWYRRNTGWFGHALASARARICVPGLQANVTVEDVGLGTPELRAAVDAAYRTKYGHLSARQMVSDDAAATTLRLSTR